MVIRLPNPLLAAKAPMLFSPGMATIHLPFAHAHMETTPLFSEEMAVMNPGWLLFKPTRFQPGVRVKGL
jgi:hypothetical protein